MAKDIFVSVTKGDYNDMCAHHHPTIDEAAICATRRRESQEAQQYSIPTQYQPTLVKGIPSDWEGDPFTI